MNGCASWNAGIAASVLWRVRTRLMGVDWAAYAIVQRISETNGSHINPELRSYSDGLAFGMSKAVGMGLLVDENNRLY